MIVRDDSERGIPPLVTHQPPSSLDDAPVIRGRMVQIPGWIIPLYAGLFIALGWLAASSGVTRHRRKRCPCRWRMRRFCR
ncbi:pullulanase-specific type II secretion system component B [Klebsiella pneumoniae subsp. ozaenae]|uniref:Pullulanase-specific type II secretion system component B n=1 Tax=Klebsiella pneumoniae subsp. ozaenae TaxID=574 RepID=A0A378C2X8_KLEPO|nr:pullulanase-specific type II secretion system component B [Klebsiella pneumoniae subsp. ozaenae]